MHGWMQQKMILMIFITIFIWISQFFLLAFIWLTPAPLTPVLCSGLPFAIGQYVPATLPSHNLSPGHTSVAYGIPFSFSVFSPCRLCKVPLWIVWWKTVCFRLHFPPGCYIEVWSVAFASKVTGMFQAQPLYGVAVMTSFWQTAL